jgi:hypothetical protein
VDIRDDGKLHQSPLLAISGRTRADGDNDPRSGSLQPSPVFVVVPPDLGVAAAKRLDIDGMARALEPGEQSANGEERAARSRPALRGCLD